MEEFHSAPRRGYTKKQAWAMLTVGVGCVIAFVLIVATPVVLKQSKKAAMTTSTSHAKCVYMLFHEFDQDFGEFPSDRTALLDSKLNGYVGNYSNDYLGQFFAGGYVKSEEIFYAKGGSSINHKPDNDFSTKAKTLEAGECGFAYIKGLNTKSHHETPILVTPMSGDGFKFNRVYDGKCVVLRLDGAVKQHRLDKNNHAGIGGGKTLFEGGEDTVWGVDGLKKVKVVFPK